MESTGQQDHKPNGRVSLPNDNSGTAKRSGLALFQVALGVVFGDIATSPLYALRECFHGEYGIAPMADNVLGVLSLMFWALMIIVGLKYLTFVIRADNHGEGGVIALTSLIQRMKANGSRRRFFLVAIGLFAASLLYGDGMITPAISVLSAVEGLRTITPAFEPYVIPATVAILLALFAIQKRGTARIGTMFGPIIMVWLIVLAVLGVSQIIRHPQIFAAIAPWHGVGFLIENRLHGFLVLGAVFLVVTGAEALYADLGHFGKTPIRRAWFFAALPALLLNYFGQGALLLWEPNQAHHPFYAMVPGWAIIPMVVLATTATIIASQAVITAAFSLTRQAVQMGYLPRIRITHTSSRHMGQIYVPFVNWVLMLATVGLVLGLESSSKLAAAYGVAVTSTMLIATVLFYVVAREHWGWKWWMAAPPAALFAVVDASFLAANVSKLLHGAWFPLAIGAIIFTLMITWRKGRQILASEYRSRAMSWADFRDMMADSSIPRVAGAAVFFSSNPDVVPTALLHNLDHNKVLHSNLAVLHITSETVPRMPNDQKVTVEKLAKGVYQITARYGFMESPDVANILSLARSQGVDFDLLSTSFFFGRERLAYSEGRRMALWRKRLFAFMSRNAMDASAFYCLPVGRVIDVGIQLRL